MLQSSPLLKKPYAALWIVLSAKALFFFLAILYAGIALGPDEAQYWTWSQNLSFGYYSKPPGIAWQIWLSTALFGQSELGIRLSAVILSLLLSLSIYRLARIANLSERRAFFAAVAMALSPLGMLGSLVATTDGASILLQTMALSAYYREREEGSFLKTALWILLASLFKWTSFLLWLFFLADAKRLGHAVKHRLLGLLLSLFGLLPSLYWNSQHDFVTFRHVFYNIAGQKQASASAGLSGNPLEFLGAQLALLSPIIFILLCRAFYLLFTKKEERADAADLCGEFALAFLTASSALSIFTKMQGNWCAYIYPAAMVYLAASLKDLSWLKRGIYLSGLLSMAFLAIPSYQASALSERFPLPQKNSPLKHLVGWPNLKEALLNAGYRSECDALLADSYQMTSLLSFYAPKSAEMPKGQSAYFLNLQGARRNQFSYWPSFAESQAAKSPGSDTYFVYAENAPLYQMEREKRRADYQSLLSRSFTEVSCVLEQPLYIANGQEAKTALIFRCRGFTGFLPADPDLY
jgi:4-amino-4-deoxy-L-arabinose transferase-like glycosyltransferase